MLRTRSPRKEKISNCYLHSNSLSNKMDNSLLAVRDINHKYIVVEGKKEVLSITVGDNESSKYWLSVLNELKNRGVKDILIICADGLSSIKEAIAAAFPKTEYQRCIVHQVRNTLKYVPDKDRKAFASDLKTIYHASDEEKARLALDRVTEKKILNLEW